MIVDFPPHSLRDYTLIADGERGGLIGPHGDVSFLCAPRWHDDAVFSGLIGGAGVYAVTPVGRYVWGGSYLPGSLIWQHSWATAGGSIVECRDALARPAERGTVVVLRQIQARKGAAATRVVLDVRAEFGVQTMSDLRREEGGWTGRSGALWFRWDGAPGAVIDEGGRLIAEVHLPPGGRHDLVLQIGVDEPAPLDVARAWDRTLTAWSRTPAMDGSAAPRDARQALAVLTGLTSVDGGMVAAATMSLPEREGTATNYDYRYAWIRDQAHAGIAAAAAGCEPLVRVAAEFIGARLFDDGPALRPAYLVDGSPVPGERRLSRSGYPGATDIVGNHAGAQFQLDTFGEALQLFAAAERLGVASPHHRAAAAIAVDAIARRWTDPDAGVWELDDRRWSHSRLVCVAGLRQWSDFVDGAGRDRLGRLADAVFDGVVRECWDPRGFFRRSPGDLRVDAAALFPIVRGAFDPSDPRAAGTLAEIRRSLVDDFYVYRFAEQNGRVGRSEGAFLFCGFMFALAELQAGDAVAAFRSFERNRGSCGPSGLLSEEFDVIERQLRGNLPQAFVHAALLDAAVRLGDGRPSLGPGD